MVVFKNKKWLAGALLVGLSYATPTFAQTTKTTWTLQECIDYGVKSNLQIKQAELNGNLANVNLRQVKGNILPSLSAGTSYSTNFGLNNDPTTGLLVNRNTRANNVSVNMNVPLFSGFQLRNSIKQNQYNLQASQLDIEKTKNDIILNIVSAYLQVILSDELLQTAQLQLATSQEQASRTQKLFKAGSVAESNVFEINSQIASDEVNIVNAQNNKDIAELNLIQLLNLQQVKDFEVVKLDVKDPDETLINFNAEDVYAQAQERMPEIRSADTRVNSALVGVNVARGALYPQLSFGGSFSTSYFNLNKVRTVELGEEQSPIIGFLSRDVNQTVTSINTFRIPITEPYTYFTQLLDNRGGGVFLNLNIPIFNGFRARNGVQQATINHQNAVLNTEIVRNQLRQTIQQSYADASAAQKRFIATKRQLAALELTFKNAQIRFNNGIINPTDFNVARNNFVRAQSDLIQAKYQYTFRLKVLEFYQGKPISL